MNVVRRDVFALAQQLRRNRLESELRRGAARGRHRKTFRIGGINRNGAALPDRLGDELLNRRGESDVDVDGVELVGYAGGGGKVCLGKLLIHDDHDAGLVRDPAVLEAISGTRADHARNRKKVLPIVLEYLLDFQESRAFLRLYRHRAKLGSRLRGQQIAVCLISPELDITPRQPAQFGCSRLSRLLQGRGSLRDGIGYQNSDGKTADREQGTLRRL